MTRTSVLCDPNLGIAQGFKYYVDAEDADILILTETKVRAQSQPQVRSASVQPPSFSPLCTPKLGLACSAMRTRL